jgi:hypothetical protein
MIDIKINKKWMKHLYCMNKGFYKYTVNTIASF